MSTAISLTPRKGYKIILLGQTGVGKTSIIERYVNDQFDPKEQATIGIDFFGKTITHRGSKCRVQLWDSAGQEKYMSLIPAYLRDADCVLFVFETSNPKSLEGIQKWINLFRMNHTKKSVTLLCGNKSDLPKNINKDKLTYLMDKYHMPYHAVSAKTGQNLNELFNLALDMINITKKQDGYKPNKDQLRDEIETQATEGRMTANTIKINSEEKQEKSCYC